MPRLTKAQIQDQVNQFENECEKLHNENADLRERLRTSQTKVQRYCRKYFDYKKLYDDKCAELKELTKKDNPAYWKNMNDYYHKKQIEFEQQEKNIIN